MTDVENILNDDEFFVGTVDTLKEGVDQHRKREFLIRAVSKGKVLGSKKQQTHEKVDKASDGTINKTYADNRQLELKKSVKKLEKLQASM